MILRFLEARDFLKYPRLDLPEIPAEGLIGITGENESGKSSIGETICFALFGRTFAVRGDETEKLIRWGESRCSVRLGFVGGDGEVYEIRRLLDRDGNQGARLSRADAPESPLAKGVASVAEAMERHLGFDFEEYIESFYLAQREITTPHPHSEAVRIMAGVAPLERVRAALEAEMGREAASIAELERQIQDLDEQMRHQGFEPERMAEASGRLERSQALLQRINEVEEGLRAAAAGFADSRRRLASLLRGRRWTLGLGMVGLLSGLFGVGTWWLLTDHPNQPLAQVLQAGLEGISPGFLLYAGIGLLGLAVLSFLRYLLLGARLKDLQGKDAGLAEALARLDALEADLPAEVRAGLAPSPDSPGKQVEQRARVREGLARGGPEAREVQALVEHELHDLEKVRAVVEELGTLAKEELAHHGERKGEYDKLAAMAEAVRKQIADHRHRIQVRELAGELLAGATREVSARFNHNLRGLVGKTLPLFTQGRYEHLRIDPDLQVQVFSAEKRDFMDLEEVSSGTQRQIMLALRLALSQELVNRVVKGPQFLFLDEPFAFFDEARTRSALEALPRLSAEMRQIWVVAQVLPEDCPFVLRLHCRGDRVESIPRT